MPKLLNRLFAREHAAKKGLHEAASSQPQEVKYQDAWLRTEISPEEAQELLRGCTNEIKLRGLSTPFLLLPFRPNTDPSAAKNLIRNVFNPSTGPLSGAQLAQELRLSETMVLCSAMKWCWSRLPGGVVTWDVYELFRQGEADSSMARDSFATFIPISAESKARSDIIFDFFDLLSAISAHAKHNGLGGMKLSRLAGWWAFEHSDFGWGFEGGYASWERAASASCHLFFAYLRSLSPADGKAVSMLPTSLKALLANTGYPPVVPQQMQTKTSRVVIMVHTVSPTPFALLRRAKHFQYHYPETEKALKTFSEFQDPIQALTEECKRVLRCISSTNQSGAGSFKLATGVQEQTWSRFQDIGFSDLMDESDTSDDDLDSLRRRRNSTQSPLTPPREPELDLARPTTPSWADFMSSGFGDRHGHFGNVPAPMLLPPDKQLPPIAVRSKSSQSHRRDALENLDPGELSSVSPQAVDDAFWWVWICSLAGEETAPRKATFGRCALAETNIKGGKWLVVEEKIKGAVIPKEDAAILASKKQKKTKRSRLTRRRRSIGRAEHVAQATEMKRFDPSMASLSSRTNIGPDQTAKIQAAAAALRQQQVDQEFAQFRNKPVEARERPSTRTNSVFTLQPLIMSEATPAMKWANRYDRDALREKYLNGVQLPTKKLVPSVADTERTERQLPALPKEEPAEDTKPKEVQQKPVTSLIPQGEEEPAPRSRPASLASPKTPVSLPASPQASRPSPKQQPESPAANGRSSPASKRRSMPAGPKPLPTPEAPKEVHARPKVSRLRQMFQKKAQAAESPQKSVPPSNVDRKASLRKKHTPMNVPELPDDAAGTEPTVQEPEKEILAVSTSAEDEHPVENKTKEDKEAAAAKAFSSFDQGPLEDQPAFVPDSADVSESESPVESSARSKDSFEPSPPVSPIAPVHDRWAQIRKNAAERAAKVEAKASEESSRTGGVSMDDGETSGEETIESRVRRIKARVAELTGNVDAPARV